MKRLTPFLLGTGSAGTAMAKSLAIIQTLYPELPLDPVVKLKRGQGLAEVARAAHPLLLVANPHGLHAQVLLEAKKCGIRNVVVEKPAAVSLSEVEVLTGLDLSVAVCHGYRQMWGPRTIQRWLADGKLGQLITIEGRYWQSSTAARAIHGAAKDSWKNDRKLNGDHDTLVDLGAHWMDLVLFLHGTPPSSVEKQLFYANAEAPHRDSHVHLAVNWQGGARAFASISKTFHGSGNDLELHVLGTKGRASWYFQQPDVVQLGVGGELQLIPRASSSETPSHQAPFHALGWLEGYVDVLLQTVRRMSDLPAGPVPTLDEHLRAMRFLLAE